MRKYQHCTHYNRYVKLDVEKYSISTTLCTNSYSTTLDNVELDNEHRINLYSVRSASLITQRESGGQEGNT